MKSTRNIINLDQLKKNVDDSIKNIKKENYINYFNYAYLSIEDNIYNKKDSTLKRELKNYKL